MGFRPMWKMVHLLHLYGRPGLTRTELFNAGVECNPHNLQPLLQSGIVEDGRTDDEYRLSGAAEELIKVCIVAHRHSYGGDMRVDFPHAFVIMPFSEDWSNDVYTQMIEPAVRAANFDCTRGDKTVRVGDLSTNIWSGIMQAGIIIADVSVANVNVFYELGVAHALGKDTLLLKRRGVSVPADFEGALYCEYDPADLGSGRDMLQSELEKWAAEHRAANVKALYHS
jgi:hypothetical protein